MANAQDSRSDSSSGSDLEHHDDDHEDEDFPQSHGKQRRGSVPALRGSCDFCTRRKRKCDGMHPCSTCRDAGVGESCVYSARQKTGRKKKPRIEDMDISGTATLGAYYPGIGLGQAPFSASPATGLVGYMESYFLASYLRDFNRFVPLTTEVVVTRGMLEALAPAVSVPDPFLNRLSVSQHHARLAVLWGVIAMGGRITGIPDSGVERYVRLMRASLKECFDSGDTEVVQAYLLLATLESMRGHNAKARRYLNFASTMYSGIKAAEGAKEAAQKQQQQQQGASLAGANNTPLLTDGSSGSSSGGSSNSSSSKCDGDEAMDVVLNMYQHKIAPGLAPRSDRTGGGGICMDFDTEQQQQQQQQQPMSGSDCPIKQRIAAERTRPADALRLLMCTSGYTRTALDPRSTCPKVRASLEAAHNILQSTKQVVMRTSLSECIASVVPVRTWAGVTLCMRGEKETGVKEVESAMELALMRPGLMTFPLWWHAVHCAAVVLAHFGRHDAYVRIRAAYNAVTFDGTQLPELSAYHAEAICLEGSHCRALAHWLNRTQTKARYEDCGAEGLAYANATSKPSFSGPATPSTTNAFSSSGGSSSGSGGSHAESFGGGGGGSSASELTPDLIEESALDGAFDASWGEGGAEADSASMNGEPGAFFNTFSSAGTAAAAAVAAAAAAAVAGELPPPLKMEGRSAAAQQQQQMQQQQEMNLVPPAPLPSDVFSRLESFNTLELDGIDMDLTDMGSVESFNLDASLSFGTAPEQLNLQAQQAERAVAAAVSGSVLDVPSAAAAALNNAGLQLQAGGYLLSQHIPQSPLPDLLTEDLPEDVVGGASPLPLQRPSPVQRQHSGTNKMSELNNGQQQLPLPGAVLAGGPVDLWPRRGR